MPVSGVTHGNGFLLKQPVQVITNMTRLEPLSRQCSGGHMHGKCRGDAASESAYYSDEMVQTIGKCITDFDSSTLAAVRLRQKTTAPTATVGGSSASGLSQQEREQVPTYSTPSPQVERPRQQQESETRGEKRKPSEPEQSPPEAENKRQRQEEPEEEEEEEEEP